MEKILLVTAQKAAGELKKIAARNKDVVVHICKADVAALLSSEDIIGELGRVNLGNISLIMVPGGLRGDVSIISRKLGVECVKGPMNIADIELVIKKVGDEGFKLSSKEPADIFLQKELLADAGKIISQAYVKPKKDALKIGGKNPVYLGAGISHIVAEIIDAPLLSEKELVSKAKYYVESGAEIIDVGMVAGRDNSKRVAGIIGVLRSSVNVPLSIDSLREKEIAAAVNSGVDLVLSIDETNCGLLSSIDVPVVLIPRNKKGVVPNSAKKRLEIISGLTEKTDKNFLVDMVLSPINYGFTESVKAYSLFREENPVIPLFMGAGNVSELFDADSVGVNALIAAMASELSVDLILTTEASRKTRGSVSELRKASEMMYLSRKKRQLPKDLGVNMLVLKDKKTLLYPVKDIGLKAVRVGKDGKYNLEDAEFEIYLSDVINVVYFKNSKPSLHFVGKVAEDLYKEIISRDLLKELDHAAYLGKELYKAELALKLGKNYVQDRELF